jgi:hypothetical protein
MILWVLTVFMAHGSTTYGYKFMEKANCDKVGKDITKGFKNSKFTCKKKRYVIE